MKRMMMYAAAVLLVLAAATETQAQNLLERAAQRARQRAEQKVEQKVNETVDKTVEGVFQTAEEAVLGTGEQPAAPDAPAAAAGQPAAAAEAALPPANEPIEMTYAKSDFVAGDIIIFEDDLSNEKLGEFPSQWDLLGGSVEVANVAGVPCIYIEGGSGHIAPLMKNMRNFLSDVFTLEMDYWVNRTERMTQGYAIRFQDEAKKQNILDINFGYTNHQHMETQWVYYTPDGERRDGRLNLPVPASDSWHHLSISFNKRALKIYIDGVRVANVPNMAAPANFTMWGRNWGTSSTFREAFANVRLAEGAVPLYDRMLTDGKFITYGITFDVGKATIKPESMGEITRIVAMMTENPELKFSVEGHTDSTGNAAANQTLSEARSAAIVEKLTEMGVAADRLTASGKGQNSPIADNDTDEGRARNRRVEFVKM